MSSEIEILYVTVASTEEGKKIAHSLLEKKLIACANLMPSHTAIYPWEGKIEEGSERILLLKTQKGRVPEITEMIQELHSYDCPCILNWGSGANTPFANWVHEATNK